MRICPIWAVCHRCTQRHRIRQAVTSVRRVRNIRHCSSRTASLRWQQTVLPAAAAAAEVADITSIIRHWKWTILRVTRICGLFWAMPARRLNSRPPQQQRKYFVMLVVWFPCQMYSRNRRKSSKRSGIATNPAVRMIRNRFDSAAQLIRRTNNILTSGGSSGQGSSSIGVKSGTFQWRKESQM